MQKIHCLANSTPAIVVPASHRPSGRPFEQIQLRRGTLVGQTAAWRTEPSIGASPIKRPTRYANFLEISKPRRVNQFGLRKPGNNKSLTTPRLADSRPRIANANVQRAAPKQRTESDQAIRTLRGINPVTTTTIRFGVAGKSLPIIAAAHEHAGRPRLRIRTSQTSVAAREWQHLSTTRVRRSDERRSSHNGENKKPPNLEIAIQHKIPDK